MLTLAIFARWGRFGSERDFYRFPEANLRDVFPTLPDRSQFNRLVRSCTELIKAFVSHLMRLLTDAQKSPYQALDGSRADAAATARKVCQDKDRTCTLHPNKSWKKVKSGKASGGTYHLSRSKTKPVVVLAGAGPQIEFVTATGPSCAS